MLRSLVIPLEEEIKALKEKLRTSDEENQKYRLTAGISKPTDSATSALVGMLNECKSNQNLDVDANTKSIDVNADTNLPEEPMQIACEMCNNYESQLVTAQNETESLRKDIERYNEELAKEAELRRDLESKWQEKRDKYKQQVQQLEKKVEYDEKELAALQRHYTTFKEEVNNEFLKLTSERETIHHHLTTLQDDNDFLAGRYMASSEEMQNQLIDLPNTVEELQEFLLQSHQSLIEARVGCEFAQRKCTSSADESQVLRDQLQSAWEERQASDRDFTARIKSLE